MFGDTNTIVYTASKPLSAKLVSLDLSTFSNGLSSYWKEEKCDGALEFKLVANKVVIIVKNKGLLDNNRLFKINSSIHTGTDQVLSIYDNRKEYYYDNRVVNSWESSGDLVVEAETNWPKSKSKFGISSIFGK